MSTIREHQQVLPTAQLSEGRRPNSNGQATERTRGTAADGFLKQCFLPLCHTGWRKLPETAATEQAFFTSYDKLCQLYTLKSFPAGQERPYPANILLSLWDAERQLSTTLPYSNLSLADEKEGAICVDEYCEIGNSLYYIPVIPQIHIAKRKPQAGKLLLSVFSYLYREAGIPFYRNNDSYLYGEYEMLREWVEEEIDEDNEENVSLLDELELAEGAGDQVLDEIIKPVHLKLFERRLEAFRSRTKWEQGLHQIASAVFQLYQQFPGAHIYSHIVYDEDGENDEQEYILQPWQYFSFVADTRGNLWETVLSNLNASFGEYGQVNEPYCKLFMDNQRTAIDDNLQYERSLLKIIGDLADHLEQFQ